MASSIFNFLSQDNPFDSTDRMLFRSNREERRAHRERRRDLRSAKKGDEIDVDEETNDEMEARETREAEELAEQTRLAEESLRKVTEATDRIGNENVTELTERINAKKEAGELTEDQLRNLPSALRHLERIQDFEGDEVHGPLLTEFRSSHMDLLLTNDEILKIREMIDQRFELRDAHLETPPTDVGQYSLLFIKTEEGIRPNKEDNTLRPATEYTVDFIDPDTGQINRTAQNKVNLGHMMMATDVNHVKVKSARNGRETDAYLWTNGKTYNKEQHSSNMSGLRYVAIYHGDTITTDAAPAAAEATPVAQSELERILVEGAIEADRASTDEIAGVDQEVLELAINNLERGSHADIPDALRGYRGKDYEAELAHMSMGPFVIDQLNILSEVQGEGASATQLWDQIRRKCWRSKRVSFNEISKVVLNQSADRIFEKQIKSVRESSISLEGDAIGDYEEFRARKDVLTRMKAAYDDNTTITFKQMLKAVSDPNTAEGRLDRIRFYSLSDGMLTDEHPYHFVESKLDDVIEETDSVIEMYATTFRAANNLLEAIPQLNPREDAEIDARGYEKAPEVTKVVEPVINALFPPDKEIDVDRKFFDWMFGRTSGTANWENMGERADYDYDAIYEQSISANTANNKLRNRVTSVEGTTETVDLVEFAYELEKLRQLGFTESAPDEPFQARQLSDYDSNANIITVEKMQAIQNGGKVEDVLGETTMELIKRGMIIDQMNDVAEQMNNEAEEIERRKNETIEKYGENTQEILRILAAENEDITAEELDQFGKNIDKVHYLVLGIAKTRHEEYVGKDKKPENVEEFFGASVSKPFQIGENAYLVPTVSGNVFSYELRGSLAVSGSRRLGKRDRVTLGGSAGLSAGPEEGTFLGLRGSVSYDLDKFHEWNIGVSGGVGVGPNFDQLSIAFLGFSVGRDLEGAILKDTSQLAEEREDEIDKAIERLGEQFDEEAGDIENVPQAQLENMKEQLTDYYYERVKLDAMDAMRTLQFTKLNVTLTAAGIPIVTGLVAFKGKIKLFYSQDSMIDLDDSAQSKIDAIARENNADEVIEVALSPGLTLAEGETRTYDRTPEEFDPYNRFDAMATAFAENQEVIIASTDTLGAFTLQAMKLDGMLKVYGDEGAGVRVDANDDGEVLVQIQPGQRLSIHRVDKYYSLPNGGYNQITEIFISNNRHKDLNTIRNSNDTHVSAAVSHRQGVINTKAEVSRHALSRYDVAEGPEFTEENLEAMRASQRELDAAMGATAEVISIDQERQEQLRNLTNQIIESGRVSFDFAKEGSASSYDRILLEQANKALALLGQEDDGPKNNSEKVFVLQTLLTETRAAAPANADAFIDHVVGWNTRSLTSYLRDKGVEPAVAKSISKKLMNHYGREIRRGIHNSEALTATAVERGFIIQTQIGHSNLGNHMEFLNGSVGNPVELVGLMDMNATNLQNLGLNPTEIDQLLASKGWGPLEATANSPKDHFENPIILSLLEQSSIIFGPEHTNALAVLAETRPASIDGLDTAQANAYNELCEVAEALESTGAVEHNGRVYTLKREVQMGFLNECRNFTTAHKVSVALGGGGANVDVVAGVRSEAGVRMHQIGGSGAVRVTSERREEPPTEEEDAEKIESGAVLSEKPWQGSIRPGDDRTDELEDDEDVPW